MLDCLVSPQPKRSSAIKELRNRSCLVLHLYTVVLIYALFSINLTVQDCLFWYV